MAAEFSIPSGPVDGLDAVTIRDRIAGGALKAVDVAEAFLAVTAAKEPQIGAWAFLDREHVLAQASALDAYRSTGRPLGPLHGVPVGVKDIIDTARMPTENGTVLDAGRVPTEDAAIIRRLKAAGAVIMGKTVTTELAFLHPSKTRNPANPDHTPGGSSSGSAAAVAAGMVPLAIGTQTGGSVIRPASYCGVTGFKPSFGAISRAGILAQSPSLDTVGVFARTIEDAALVAEVLFGHDPADRATTPAPHPRLLDTARSAVPVRPTFAFVRTPFWDEAEPAMQGALEELAGLLGEQCFEADLPSAFAAARDIRETINYAEMAKCYDRYRRSGGQLSETITNALSQGMAIPAQDYIAALDWPPVYGAALDELFARADVLLTPAAAGPAPHGFSSTGSPVFNGLWTLCGVPAITLPLFEDENGMPIGAQLIGRKGDDGRLLRTARWLAAFIAGQ